MFSIKESLKYGWEKFKANLNLSLCSTLLILVIGSLGELFGKDYGPGKLILVIALSVVSIILRIGYNKIFLRMSDGESPKFGDIFQEYKLFWKFLGVSILTALAVLGGLILLIIPGIIFALRYSFAALIVVDTNMGPVAAMKESAVITKGVKWQLLGFCLVLGLVNIVGVLALGVGLLVSLPVSNFALIHVYRKLTESKAAVSTTPIEAPVVSSI